MASNARTTWIAPVAVLLVLALAGAPAAGALAAASIFVAALGSAAAASSRPEPTPRERLGIRPVPAALRRSSSTGRRRGAARTLLPSGR
jgi:hypothetical protein